MNSQYHLLRKTRSLIVLVWQLVRFYWLMPLKKKKGNMATCLSWHVWSIDYFTGVLVMKLTPWQNTTIISLTWKQQMFCRVRSIYRVYFAIYWLTTFSLMTCFKSIWLNYIIMTVKIRWIMKLTVLLINLIFRHR